jgi:hypothetical protein
VPKGFQSGFSHEAEFFRQGDAAGSRPSRTGVKPERNYDSGLTKEISHQGKIGYNVRGLEGAAGGLDAHSKTTHQASERGAVAGLEGVRLPARPAMKPTATGAGQGAAGPEHEGQLGQECRQGLESEAGGLALFH